MFNSRKYEEVCCRQTSVLILWEKESAFPSFPHFRSVTKLYGQCEIYQRAAGTSSAFFSRPNHLSAWRRADFARGVARDPLFSLCGARRTNKTQLSRRRRARGAGAEDEKRHWKQSVLSDGARRMRRANTSRPLCFAISGVCGCRLPPAPTSMATRKRAAAGDFRISQIDNLLFNLGHTQMTLLRCVCRSLCVMPTARNFKRRGFYNMLTLHSSSVWCSQWFCM